MLAYVNKIQFLINWDGMVVLWSFQYIFSPRPTNAQLSWDRLTEGAIEVTETQNHVHETNLSWF